MDDSRRPLLTEYDWGAEWKRLQMSRLRADDAVKWDRKSKSFPRAHGSHSPYSQRFLEFAGIKPGESVLDMGCGTGVLALPLVKGGNDVIAADFSEGMLEVLKADEASARKSGRTPFGSLDIKKMSWEDDWGSFGVGKKCVDVALASRSVSTSDMEASLLKLDGAARRRVCVTVTREPSPRIDREFLRSIGLPAPVGRDFLYAFNILASHGITPEVRYISSQRNESFDSRAEALEYFKGLVESHASECCGSGLPPKTLENLERWLDRQLVENPRRTSDPDVEKRFAIKDPRTVVWAFLAWTPREADENLSR